MLAFYCCAGAAAALTSGTDLLVARGLTRREASSVEARYRRRHRTLLDTEELEATFASLDALDLRPQQAAHLLRSIELRELRAAATNHDGAFVWCSYKKALCDCSAVPPSLGTAATATAAATDAAPVEIVSPQLLSVDCEFNPLRVAAVDETGTLRLDALFASTGAGTPANPRGMLACDVAATPCQPQAELRDTLLALLAGAAGPSEGCTWVAHTPQQDLAALGLSEAELRDAGVTLVDVARLGGAAAGQASSLRRMAQAHLGVEMHGGGSRHCAVQDAVVTLRLYDKLKSDDGGGGVGVGVGVGVGGGGGGGGGGQE